MPFFGAFLPQLIRTFPFYCLVNPKRLGDNANPNLYGTLTLGLLLLLNA
jgi:hypothetical protein